MRTAETAGPVLVHIITNKGQGYLPAETSQDKMHGVVKFDLKTGKQATTTSKTMSYTNYFADALSAEAERDKRIVAVHAAMAGGTGLTRCVWGALGCCGLRAACTRVVNDAQWQGCTMSSRP